MKKTKCLIAAILSMGMVLTGSMTSFATELPAQQSEETASIEKSGRIYYLPNYEDNRYHVKGNIVFLRATPGLDGTIVGIFYEVSNPWVYLNGEAENIDGYTWLRATSSSINVSGWIAQNDVGNIY